MTTLGRQVLNLGAAQQAIGVDVALFVSGGVEMNGAAFVECRGLLEAGHATQRRWLATR